KDCRGSPQKYSFFTNAPRPTSEQTAQEIMTHEMPHCFSLSDFDSIAFSTTQNLLTIATCMLFSAIINNMNCKKSAVT
ncbi:hypothetical protein, partial [Mesorhizobium sp. M1C.F.Ca.ET.176.01.1.1]|uniref:hypothetical protein n=1 Tax=Mesorhizobium sp. M1C.F.Ca.ET.176.01.1.1 TaxID=2563922 RepID=UPI001AEF2F72